MNVQDFFVIWKDIGLLLYSILKAFLPLPSLEVVLTPLCLKNPERWIIYSFEGAIGTCIGGAIGYMIAYKLGRKALRYIASEEEIQKGENLMRTHGMLAVFIGGVTPIPDFILAYLAGFTHMNFFKFTLSDGLARLLRSLLITYGLRMLGTMIPVDSFGTWFSIIILIYMVWKWYCSRKKTQAQITSKK